MATTSQSPSSPGIMVFRPTLQEFKDFSGYVKKMEDCGAHKFGIAKVIPPKEWFATRNYNMDKIGDMVIDSPIAQLVTGQQGLYQQFNIQQKPLTVRELQQLAESDKYHAPEGDSEKLERAYWKNITFNPPIYGADVAGSIYDKDVKLWNINHLNTILDLIESEKNVKILGVNTAYLYFGMWKTSFAWHTEDMDLYSINYLHFGASKSWYAIPPEHGRRLETLAAGFFPGSAKGCSQFLRHKMTVISPSMLKKYSIPFYKMTQNAGEFIITFPYGYHAGYNQGFNCAESTNFASHRWIDFGKKAKPCSCRTDNVKIEMALFVKKYQPQKYKEYMERLEKKKPSTVEQNGDEKKPLTKKQERDIKMKRYNRYPSVSGVKSLAKQVKKETENEKKPTRVKGQNRQVIKKAKDILKKAEKARRESLEKKSRHGSQATQNTGAVIPKSNERKETVSVLQTAQSVNITQPLIGDATMSDRMKKLLEIKAEMEREIQTKKSKLQNIRVARERRHNVREMKQKLRVRERAPKKSPIKSPEKSFSEEETPRKESPQPQKDVVKPAIARDRDWTVVMDGLWANQPANLEQEKAYNRCLSNYGTGCVVCAYFDHDMAQSMSNLQQATNRHHLWNNSNVNLPRVPEICFVRSKLNLESDAGHLVSDSIKSGVCKESPLVTCRVCSITVHQSCYGADADIVDSLEWYCDRCLPSPGTTAATTTTAAKAVRCELCPLRGGAFKQTTTNRWAHIVCAVAFSDVTFLNPKRRGLIDLTSMNQARTKLKCIYCQQSSNSLINNGACVQCIAGKCAQSFHLACSFHNGIPLYAGDWPVSVEVYCHKHDKTRNSKCEKRLLTEIQVDDPVYAKHKNGRYYKGHIESLDCSMYYYVIFEDGSFCHDLPPEDIVDYQPGRSYSKEEKVDVLWTDGVVYPSIVKSNEVIEKYEVVFEDGSTLSLKRNDIFREDEDLPKKVRSKLSCATETANLLWQASNIRESPTRRAKIEQKKFAKLF